MAFPSATETVYRPWGKFEKFCQNEEVTVKIITVKAGEELSVQKHKYRDELWVALDPGLVALRGEDTIFMDHVSGEAVYVPRKTQHSVKNVNYLDDARFLEIAYGIFDENDIERVRDKYGRS